MSFQTIAYPRLLDNATTDGFGNVKKAVGFKQTYMLIAWGGFGGGTVTIQISPDQGTTWLVAKACDGSPLTFTEPGTIALEWLAADLNFRAELTGSTSADVTVELR